MWCPLCPFSLYYLIFLYSVSAVTVDSKILFSVYAGDLVFCRDVKKDITENKCSNDNGGAEQSQQKNNHYAAEMSITERKNLTKLAYSNLLLLCDATLISSRSRVTHGSVSVGCLACAFVCNSSVMMSRVSRFYRSCRNSAQKDSFIFF